MRKVQPSLDANSKRKRCWRFIYSFSS